LLGAAARNVGAEVEQTRANFRRIEDAHEFLIEAQYGLARSPARRHETVPFLHLEPRKSLRGNGRQLG
jgi:hypothetical protein